MKHLKEMIVQKVHECFDIAHAHWKDETFKFPNIRFDIRGVTAGTANVNKWELNFNMVLCEENINTFIARTVPHEVAHLIAYQVYDSHAPRYNRNGKLKKIQAHGPNWKYCMRVFGADSSRCHDFDTSNARVRKITIYKYECTGCNHILEMGIVRHKKHQSGHTEYYHTKCGKKTPLLFIGKF